MATGTLTSTKPAATYKSLLKVQGTNQVLDSTLRVIEDGDGNDSSLKLTVTGSTDGASFIGRVGIGTDDPSGSLELSSATADEPDFIITNNSTTADDQGGNIIFQTGDGPIGGTQANLTDEDVVGDIRFRGLDISDDAYITAGLIRCQIDGTPGTNEMPGALKFYTNTGVTDAGSTIKMSIKADGQVGIGTTSPHTNTLLEVEKDTGAYSSSDATANACISISNNADTNGDGVGILFRTHSTTSSTRDCAIIAKRESSTASSLRFITAGDSTDVGERMCILKNGYVGIGTDDPGFGLELKSAANDVSRAIVAKSTAASGAVGGGMFVVISDDGAAMGNDHRLGSLTFQGAEDASNNLIVGARIEAFADEAWDASNNGAYLAFNTASADDNEAEKMRIDMNGNVGIGTSAFSSGVACLGLINGTDPGGTTTNTACLLALSGEMNYTDASGNIATLDSLSDERAKDNITVIPDALSRLENLKGVTFNYVSYKNSTLPFKDNIEDGITFASHDKYGNNKRVGIIAQDVEKAYDGLDITNAVMNLAVESKTDVEEVPYYDDDGNENGTRELSLNTSTKYGDVKKVRVETLIPLIIEAVKELSAEVDKLKA